MATIRLGQILSQSFLHVQQKCVFLNDHLGKTCIRFFVRSQCISQCYFLHENHNSVLLIFISSVMDYTVFNFIERLVFENLRPNTIAELKAKLVQIFADINENHKDILWKSLKNFKVNIQLIKKLT